MQIHTLPTTQPTAVAFLDESGAIANDRFFAVGCLKLAEPAPLLRELQSLRDRCHWYQFSCFVCDRRVADPVGRFGGQFEAYEALATQLVIGSVGRRELLTVLADNYSTPAGVRFEESLKAKVNRRLGRLAITNVVRLDSKAAAPLQLVDLLVSAVAFEFRQRAGLAGVRTPKALMAAYVRRAYGVPTFLQGCRTPKLNVKLYESRAPGRTQRRE